MDNRLKDLRIDRGLTQGEVAEKIGKDDLFISKIEKGKTEIKLKEAARLAYVYNVSLDDIYIASKTESDKLK